MTRLILGQSHQRSQAISYCKFISILLFGLFLFLFLALPCMAQTTPLGRWATIDDVTGRQKSIVAIYAAGDTVEGKIVKTFYYPGEVRKSVCDQCQGDDYM